ncbi:MAG: hypothetical protein KY457_00145 [Actinobacteria bacterium]|nr:hypothetical protein [Actinomycetota bacterium]
MRSSSTLLNERDPDELTTTELLIASRQPLDETGDPDRAARARRLARLYLERRERRVRAQREAS